MCFDVLNNLCFMNQYTALGQAGMVGHIVQPRVVVEQSPDPDLVQTRNLPTAVTLVRVLPQKDLRATQMGVQVC